MLRPQGRGRDTHHHGVMTGGNRIAQTHQPYLQLIAAQARRAAHTERMDHPRLAQQIDRINKARLVEPRQVLPQRRLDIPQDLPMKRRLLR